MTTVSQTASYAFSENYIVITLPQSMGGHTHVIGGFDEGSEITINRTDPTWTMKQSPDGKFMTRVKNSVKSHMIQFTLMSTGVSNDVLAAIHDYDSRRTDNAALFNCTFASKTGRDVFASTQAFIVTPESHSYASDNTTRQWTIHLPNAETTIGGSALVDQQTAKLLSDLGVELDPRWITA